MKKFLLKTSIFIVYAFLLQVVFPYVVDPFNVFHADKIRANGIEPNENYIKMKYILKNPKQFDGFVFGSSRVGAIHTENIQSEKIYNMTYSVGLPSEHLASISTLIKQKIYPSTIYIGIDNLACSINPERHITDPMRCPYEYLYNDMIYFLQLYLKPSEAIRSIWGTLNAKWFINVEAFYKYGWWCEYGRESKFNWNSDEIIPSIGNDLDILQNAISDMQEIVKICKEHGIKLVIFTNPMHHVTYMASAEQNYFEFLRGIAEITDFYNFSSLNNVTLNNDNYLETSHYKAEIGDMIIDVICNGKRYDGLYEQGFGVKVTKENADEFIEMLKAQAETFSKKSK